MAVLNSEVLKDNVVQYSRQPDLKMPATFAMNYDPKRHCVRMFIHEIADPFPSLWGLLLGDVVHNFRASLDHLAWALYKRGRTPDLTDWQEKGIYFPIALTRDSFNACLVGKRQKLPGVSRADRAIVRYYQPYKAGETRAYRHVFAVLDELAQRDKHRTLQPVIAVPEAIDFGDVVALDCEGGRISLRCFEGLLEPGAELARFYVRKTGPNPRIDVKPHFTMAPAIHKRLTLLEFLERTTRSVSIVLSEFAEPPKSVRALLGEPLAGNLVPAQG